MKTAVLFLLLLCPLLALAQSRQLKKASKLFRAQQYTEAARHYEAAPEISDNRSARAKLAYCYLQNNRTERAESLYAEIIDQPRLRAETFFHYAETLRANGKYAEAKQFYEHYQELEPADERVPLALNALREIEDIQPLFAAAEVTEFSYNTDADDSTPILVGDRLYFSSDRDPGTKMLKQKSGWTGRDFLRIYVCERREGGGFTEPNEIGKLNELNKNTGNPTLTKSGTRIYFTKNANRTSKRGTLNMQLFTAVRDDENQGWRDVELLPFCSPEYNFMHPAVSPDGQTLFFTSDKPGSQGGTDLWWTRRKRDGTWGRTKNLGSTVNTAAHEGYPYFAANGKLYFCSKGHPGYGGFDILRTEWDDRTGSWRQPVNLGQPINSSRDDVSFYLDPDGKRGLFSSGRDGDDDDIYLFETED